MVLAARHPGSSRAYRPRGTTSLLHGTLEPGRLLRSAPLLEPADGHPRLLAQGRPTGGCAEARVRAQTIPGAYQVVDIPLDLPRLDTVGVPGLDCKALVDDIRDRGHDPRGIAAIGSHLRLVAVAGQGEPSQADDHCTRAEPDESHAAGQFIGLTVLPKTEGDEAVPYTAAWFIRPFHCITG